MDSTTINSADHDMIVNKIIDDTEKACVAISKNSRLNTHVKKLVLVNNSMRAFLILFDLGKEENLALAKVQDALNMAMVRVVSRHSTSYTTSDKVAIREAVTYYASLLRSTGEEELEEVMRYIDANNYGNQAVLVTKKTLRRTFR